MLSLLSQYNGGLLTVGGAAAEALAKAGVKLVPDVVAGGGEAGHGGLVDALLAQLIRDKAA